MGTILPWEIVFGNAAQVNIAAAGLGKFDGNVRAYGSRSSSTPPQPTLASSSASTPLMSRTLPSPPYNSISYGVTDFIITAAFSGI